MKSNLSPAERAELREEAQQRTLRAARLLRENEVESAEQQLRWAEQARKVLAATAGAPNKLREAWRAVAVALGCVLLAGLALGVPMWSNPLRLEAQCHALTVRLAQPWSQTSAKITASSLSLDNVQSLDLHGVPYHDGPYVLDLEDAELRIKTLRISKGARVDLDLDEHRVILSVKDGQLRGTLQVHQADLRLENSADEMRQSIAQTTGMLLEFESVIAGEMPVTLWFTSQEAWRLDHWRVDDLGFTRPDPPGSKYWVSTLGGGALTLLNTDTETVLYPADHVKLEQFQGSRLSITPDKIIAEGRANRVLSGPKEQLIRRSPTVLEYLYHQQQLALFWSAVLFLWGMFWSVRSLW